MLKQVRLRAVLCIVGVCLLCPSGAQGSVYGRLVAWGRNTYGQTDVPEGDDFIAVSAGDLHNLALKADGSILTWGSYTRGRGNIPDGNDFIAVSAGYLHSLAIKADGSIVTWGVTDRWGLGDVPEGFDFKAIATGDSHSVALRNDGSLAGWGARGNDAVPDGNDFQAIAAGRYQSLALRTDGSLAVWGGSQALADLPDGNDFVAISAGWGHRTALRANGSIIVWGGRNYYGEHDAPGGNDFVAISSYGNRGLGMRADGSLVGWGLNYWPHGDSFTGKYWVETTGQPFIQFDNPPGAEAYMAFEFVGQDPIWLFMDYSNRVMSLDEAVTAINSFSRATAESYDAAKVIRDPGTGLYTLKVVPAEDGTLAEWLIAETGVFEWSDGSRVTDITFEYGQFGDPYVPDGNGFLAISQGGTLSLSPCAGQIPA